MKVFGYQKNDEVMIELQEVSIQLSIEELNKIIKFLESVEDELGKLSIKEGICHSHLRDWDKGWKHDSVDLIIVTNFSNE